MALIPITLVTRSYSHVMPLAVGDVRPEGVFLTLDRTTPIGRFRDDPSFQAGEMSFSRYLIGLSRGDRGIVGLPIFAMHGFRQRCFFVRRGSPLRSLADLAGKRVGTNGWPDTGNTWSRAAMRTAGVDLKSITWLVGPVDDPLDGAAVERAQALLPSGVTQLPAGQTLAGLLAAAELDAVMCPWPPRDFYDPDFAIVRLFPDYQAAEEDYYRQTGIYPAHHIVGLRRELFERHPWIARSLYQAFDESRLQSQADNLLLADASPWVQADIERAMRLMGTDWQPNGVVPNQHVIAALCEEEFAQGLIGQPLDPATVFADFQRAAEE
ncbi:MAG TPA: ABC transporter substrate-binding protein [Thermomicrobiaceae bacterium]|nr:ABC transporter substrate-binding protein [Thermomicrobiaceae bacterium]